jgi:hypothetical protein
MELATDSAISQRKQRLGGASNSEPARSPMAQENAVLPLTVDRRLREIVADLSYSFAQ